MTSTFTVAYIIVAILLWIGINAFVLKRKKSKSVSKQVTDETTENKETQLKSKDDDVDHQPVRSNIEKMEAERKSSDSEMNETTSNNMSSEDQDKDSDESHEHTELSDRGMELNEDEPINEQIKKHHVNFVYGKGISRNKILVAMMFGMFIAILNQTLLNVALPVINNEFSISASTGQWLMTGFMLVNGILIPISAFLISKYSYRRLFLIAMTLFTIGSIICALSFNFPMMMTGRVIQAVGAGVLMPLGSNVFMTIFPPEKRGAAMGTLGIAFILAPAIGPTLSGWIVQNYHWNIMFYGMFAIGLVAIFISFFWFRIYQKTSNPKPDVQGIIFSTLGFGLLLYGFSEAGNDGWTSLTVSLSLIIGVIFTALFVIREVRMKNPMLDMSALKYSGFTLTTIINVIVTMSLFGGMILLPIYLQNLRGFTPLDSGLLLLPGSLIMGFMGPIAGKMLDSFGIKPLALIGLTIMTFATWELTQLNMDTPYTTILVIYIVRSFGMSFIMMPIMTAGMNSLPQRLIPHGNAISNTVRQLAGSIGTAILVTVMTQNTTTHLANMSDNMDSTNPMIQEQIKALSESVGGEEAGTTALFTFFNKLATVQGINDAFWIATLFSVIALILSLFLKGKSHYLSKE
ncbi:DHA2 family efflux MFS transporter permease subunit [Mammaliicoccus sciuri]|uniref:DHA2 family efflux MFS transporter permease subunit n=1 Tax=Mammaliicoccus sciuri TaxID=1296 RepID=UPI000BBF1E87|nr:DHA2 family efflux MFS transporter permease subunit [Mammaliicoccus sciuri]MBG9210548.1 DHA2 family efflux MFS transporter permease subunit [Mammaliicoccus sciuri]MCI8456168.1 DHA2 family efflux MFS transporter permease subunit [Mammaliicoccus sciuri]MDO0957515.1 DHA2 family efflux MFS transporter permease subunit [Mammaliicoccus sciuri]MDT0702299.1 DHA2 family efflux MFS transporter permease subunit [Mammaliicoccus sciuri]MDT0744780.1 DHA2 family efflux MFS transporter permease subunit [Ma